MQDKSKKDNFTYTAVDSAKICIDSLFLKRGDKQLYNNFSLDFFSGKITALIAPSGSGKTSLLDCISGYVQFDAGKISFFNNDEIICCRNSCKNISNNLKDSCNIVKFKPSYLFQEPRLLPWQTALQNVLLPLKNIYAPSEATKRALAFLEAVGLIDKQNSLPKNLSGGEKQRVAMARAFAFPSSVLLMDEAFQSLDIHLKIKVMELFESLLIKEPRTVVLVTHDIREALCLADQIYVLDGEPLKVKINLPRNMDSKRKLSVHDRYIDIDGADREIQTKIISSLCERHTEK